MKAAYFKDLNAVAESHKSKYPTSIRNFAVIVSPECCAVEKEMIYLDESGFANDIPLTHDYAPRGRKG